MNNTKLANDIEVSKAKKTSVIPNNIDVIEKVDSLNSLSYNLRKSDPKKALSYSEEAKRLASGSSYEKGLAYSLRNIGICNWRLADYNTSLKNFTESIHIFNKNHDKVGKASSLNGMGIVYRKLRDFTKSIEFYSESLKLYTVLNDKRGEAISLNNIGIIYTRLGNYPKALRLYNSSYQIYDAIGDKYGEATCLNNIGLAYTNLGEYSKALKSSLKAQNIFKELNDKQGEAETLTNIVIIYNKFKQYKKALTYEKQSLQIKEEINDLRGQSNSLINIGNTYYNIGELNKALNFLFKSLYIKKEISDRAGEANSLVSIAITYIKMNNLDKATKYLNESIKIQQKIEDKSGEIVSLTSLGRILINKKEYDKAIEYLQTALKLAEEIRSKDYLCEINEYLSDCYKYKNDYQKALEYFTHFYEIKNKVFKQQSDNLLKNLQVTYKLESLEEEVQKLKNLEIKNSLSELTSALDVSEIISRTDTNGAITYVNDNFCSICGYKSEELIGKNHRIFNTGYHQKEFYENLWKNILQGKTWKGEIKNKSKEGKIFWLDITIVPLFDANKKLTEFLTISQDITKRKEAEEKINRQFIELEKTNAELGKTNSELDKFVYRASHDLRSPLTSVMGLIELTKSEKKSTDIQDNLNMIKKSIDRLDRFVVDIIHYYRNSRAEIRKEKIDFNSIIKETFEDLMYIEGANKIKTNVRINERDSYYSDKSKMRVIFNNLISNAIRYNKPQSENPFVDINVSISKNTIVIQVKDNGIGIDKKYINKIFDMFFKNSNSTYSSGLGLYILKETVNILNGTISVESELNKGSSFIIQLPNK